MPLGRPQLGVSLRCASEAERGQHGFGAADVGLPDEQIDVVPRAQVGLLVMRVSERRAFQQEQMEAGAIGSLEQARHVPGRGQFARGRQPHNGVQLPAGEGVRARGRAEKQVGQEDVHAVPACDRQDGIGAVRRHVADTPAGERPAEPRVDRFHGS